MNNQRGFIQIPLLILIIFGALTAIGGGYYAIKHTPQFAKQNAIIEEKNKTATTSAEVATNATSTQSSTNNPFLDAFNNTSKDETPSSDNPFLNALKQNNASKQPKEPERKPLDLPDRSTPVTNDIEQPAKIEEPTPTNNPFSEKFNTLRKTTPLLPILEKIAATKQEENQKTGKEISILLEGVKKGLEKLYSAAEINKRYIVTGEVGFLEQRIRELNQMHSTIQSCDVSTASDIARINSTYNTLTTKQNEINQRMIESIKAYLPVGTVEYTDSAASYEKEAADKIAIIENDRGIALQNIKVACDTSPLTMFKSDLVTLISSTTQQKERIARYTETYSSFQKTVSDDIASFASYQKNAENGQWAEGSNALPYPMDLIAFDLATIDSNFKRDVTDGDFSYRLLLDAGQRASTLVSDNASRIKAMADEVKAKSEAWRQANTPMICRATSKYVGDGKINTEVICDGAGGIINQSNKLTFCHSTSQWSAGKLTTTMICRPN